MNRRRTHLDTLAISVLAFLCLLWGIQQVSIKVANVGVSPILQGGIRSAIATVLLWLWMVARGVKIFERDGSLVAGLVCGLLFSGEFLFIYWGLAYTTASRSVVFIYVSPFVVAIGAHFFVRGETLRGMQVIGLLCAFIGIIVAFADGLGLPSKTMLIGDAMALMGAFLWGATTVVIKATTLARIAPSKNLLYQLAASALLLPALSIMMGEPGIIDLNPLVIGCLLYQGVVVAFASYLAWYWLIAHYPAASLASFTFLTPLFGMLAGGILLDERITALLSLAMLLVAAGIYLVNRPTRAPKA
ncbi:MAG: DMT family transporter [Rhodospirillales bacterium]|nr:DMT family transporter [Rhodospirillales bacterium]